MNTKSERIAKPPTALTTVVTWAVGTLAGFSLFTSNSQVLEWASFNEAPQPQQNPCLVRLRGKFVGVAKTVGCWIWYAAGVGGAARAGGVLVLLLADGAGVLFGAELGLGGGMLTTRYGGCAGRSASGMFVPASGRGGVAERGRAGSAFPSRGVDIERYSAAHRTPTPRNDTVLF